MFQVQDKSIPLHPMVISYFGYLELETFQFLKLQGTNVTSNLQIIIDDQTMYSIVNNQPKTYRNVKATMGNSYEHPQNQNWLRKYSTANGKYRNLIFKSGKNKLSLIN